MQTVKDIVAKFQPYGATLLCEPLVSDEVTKGGIYIPEQCRNPLNQGKVIAVGTTLDEAEWIGKTVMWTQHSESKLRIDGVQLVCVSIDNLVLVER